MTNQTARRVLYCSVCGRATADYAVVGHKQVLCMEEPETLFTEWGRDSAATGAACFGWFAGYPYTLATLVTTIRKEYLEQMELMKEWLHRIGAVMLEVEEVLAHFEQYPIIWKLKELGLIPEGLWPPNDNAT